MTDVQTDLTTAKTALTHSVALEKLSKVRPTNTKIYFQTPLSRVTFERKCPVCAHLYMYVLAAAAAASLVSVNVDVRSYTH